MEQSLTDKRSKLQKAPGGTGHRTELDHSTANPTLGQLLRIACILICGVISLHFSGFCQAEVYTWTDEYGRVHFGDKPGKNAEVVPLASGDEPDTTTGLDTQRKRQKQLLRLLETFALERSNQAMKQQEEKQKHKERAAQCKEIHAQLEYIESGVFYRETNDPNNPEFLSEDEVRTHRKTLQQAAKKFCR